MKNFTASGLVLLGLSLGLWIGPTALRATEDTKTSIQLLNGVTTGSGTLDEGTVEHCRETAVYVVWGSGTSAGVVTVESAHTGSYAGTWAPLATVTWSAAGKEDIVQITGVHRALRARVSTTVSGGTIDVWAVCN